MAVIVLAEDDPDLLAIMTRMLQRAGHAVPPTADGAAAWDTVQQHQPDLVVSDIDMPIMSGVDLSHAVRADSRTRLLPIVLVSGSVVPGDTRPDRAQATALLPKPFLPRELIDCVAKALLTGHTDGQAPTVCP